MATTPRSPAGLQTVIDDGLTECTRVLAPRGIVIVKCQDYVSSGKLWMGTHHTLTHALDLNLRLIDRFEFIGDPSIQPTLNPDGSARRQVHARRNLSTLFVLKKPR